MNDLNGALPEQTDRCSISAKGASVDQKMVMKFVWLQQNEDFMQPHFEALIPTVQLLIACSMQKWRGKAWFILSLE